MKSKKHVAYKLFNLMFFIDNYMFAPDTARKFSTLWLMGSVNRSRYKGHEVTLYFAERMCRKDKDTCQLTYAVREGNSDDEYILEFGRWDGYHEPFTIVVTPECVRHEHYVLHNIVKKWARRVVVHYLDYRKQGGKTYESFGREENTKRRNNTFG